MWSSTWSPLPLASLPAVVASREEDVDWQQLYAGVILPTSGWQARAIRQGGDLAALFFRKDNPDVLRLATIVPGSSKDSWVRLDLVAVRLPLDTGFVELWRADCLHLPGLLTGPDRDTESIAFNERFRVSGSLPDVTRLLRPELQSWVLDSDDIAAVAFENGWLLVSLDPHCQRIPEVLRWAMDVAASLQGLDGDPGRGWEALLGQSRAAALSADARVTAVTAKMFPEFRDAEEPAVNPLVLEAQQAERARTSTSPGWWWATAAALLAAPWLSLWMFDSAAPGIFVVAATVYVLVSFGGRYLPQRLFRGRDMVDPTGLPKLLLAGLGLVEIGVAIAWAYQLGY